MTFTAKPPSSIHSIALAVLLAAGIHTAAAADCPLPAYAPPAPENIVDWYVKFIEPARVFAGAPVEPRPAKNVIEAMVGALEGFHRSSALEPLFFEPFIRQISASYAGAGDFKGLNTATAEKLNRSGAGSNMDFSTLCVDTRRERYPDDTFALTLYGVNNYNCSHVSLRGLVFTSTLINGTMNGACRPDYPFFRMLFVPVLAGTNTITFVCNKDTGGCAGR